MQAWYESELGDYMLAKEQAWFDHECADIFGFNAMQAGLCRADLLRANRMPHRFCADVDGGDLRCRMQALPVASQSLDLLVLPHVLEFDPQPHQVLREAERALRPEGRLLVSGFNPLSLWGACRVARRSRGEYPWSGRFLTLARLKDWLALLGFEVAGGRMICYVPPVNRAGWIRRFTFLEAAGDRWWALGGGVYLIHAIKRSPGMRVVTPKRDERWRTRPAVARSLPKAFNNQAFGDKRHD